MKTVKIPFRPEFKDALLSGEKIMTTRTRMMGKPGDTFEAFGATFRLDFVDKFQLDDIATLFWREEGLEGRTEFIDVWKKIHPRKGFDHEQIVWLHRFSKVSDANPRRRRRH